MFESLGYVLVGTVIIVSCILAHGIRPCGGRQSWRHNLEWATLAFTIGTVVIVVLDTFWPR